MKKIRRTSGFIKWLNKLRDSHARFRIYKRIERLANGNPGDHRFLGDISEMRINYGPGYRVYFLDYRERNHSPVVRRRQNYPGS